MTSVAGLPARRTPGDRDRSHPYRTEFGLPVTVRAGRVELTIGDHVGALHMPAALGEKVLAALRQRLLDGPVVARRNQTQRWTFLVSYDRTPSHERELQLDLLGVCIQPGDSALLLPAGYGNTPVITPGCWWIRQPARNEVLPPLSAVASTTLGASAPPTVPFARISDGATCEDDPVDLNIGKARRILADHARHQPLCKRALGARAFLSHTDDV